jgi:glycosyltransferase involved in cell wall biosynthesis
MLVRDEADIIEVTVRHLLWHVDEVIVADNRSVDGTREILEALPVDLRDDPEIAHFQDRKTTAMAMEALERGHQWVVPCDGDEIWHCRNPNHRISDWLSTLASDVMIVTGPIFNHIPSADDDPTEDNPVKRIGYRRLHPKRQKVACRLSPDLWIKQGNHKARGGGKLRHVPGLEVKHFSHRSEEQSLRKVRNLIEAYNAANGVPDDYGREKRRFDGRPDDHIRKEFRRRFFSKRPTEDAELVWDPAPARWPSSTAD